MAILNKHIKEELFRNYDGPGGAPPPAKPPAAKPVSPPPAPTDKPSGPEARPGLTRAQEKTMKAGLGAMAQTGPQVYDTKNPPNVSFAKPGTYICKAGSDGTITLRVPKPDMSAEDRKGGIRVEWSTIQIGDLKPGQQYKVSFKPIDGGKRAEVAYRPVRESADRGSAPRTSTVPREGTKPVRLPPIDNPYPPPK